MLLVAASPAAARGELRDAIFHPPHDISHSPSVSSVARISPRSIGLDRHGTAYAFWMERITHSRGANRELALSIYTAGSGWDSLITPVAWWDGAPSSDPACAIDWGGSVHLAWIDRRDGPAQVYAQLFRPAQGVMTQPLRLSDNEAPAAGVAIAVGPDGWIHAAWSEVAGSRSRLRHRTASPTGQWFTADAPATPDDRAAYGPDLVTGADGRLHMVWESGAASGTSILYASWSRAGGWSIVEAVDPAAGGRYSQTPVVAAAPDGSIWVAWAVLQEGDDTSLLLLRRRGPAGRWGPTHLVRRNRHDSLSPALAVDARGTVHLLWEERGQAPGDDHGAGDVQGGDAAAAGDAGDHAPAGDAIDIMYAAYPAGGTQAARPPRALTAPDSGPNRYPMLAVDAGGRILAAWIDYGREGGGDLMARLGQWGFSRPRD